MAALTVNPLFIFVSRACYTKRELDIKIIYHNKYSVFFTIDTQQFTDIAKTLYCLCN